jgi:arginine/lysine/ornithine decarboxylase
VLGKEPYIDDAPLHHGLDDRTSSNKILTHAQTLAADAFGADQCLFSTNGSTLSVQLALVACVRPGEEVLIGRNAHKSVISGLILSGAVPIWVDPEIDVEHACAHTVTPEALERALISHPAARAAMVVSPTYFGVAADVAGLADVCHRHDIPLLVDDAWGALFAFHPDFPSAPIEAGADLCVTSFHKSLNGIMQASVVLVKGDRVDRERLQLAMDSFETTSTSVLLLASIDGARRQMALDGEELLGETLRLARRAASELSALPKLKLMGPHLVGRPGCAGFDETKVCVDVDQLGMTGFEAADWLWAERRIGPELADHRHMTFLITLGDNDDSVDRLVEAMRDLVDAASEHGPTRDLACAEQLLADAEYVLRPRDAFLGKTTNVKLRDAVGRLAAEPVSPYPPGVPVLVPGQRVTEVIVDFLQAGVDEGMLIEGASDPSLAELRVVD